MPLTSLKTVQKLDSVEFIHKIHEYKTNPEVQDKKSAILPL